MKTPLKTLYHSEYPLATYKPVVSETDIRNGLLDQRLHTHRLEVALNNLTQGVCFFDGTKHLILANRRYAEIYGLPLECIRPGVSLTEIAGHRAAVGAFPNMTPEEYLEWRETIARHDEPSDTIVELQNGRVILIHHRPMPDNGWVSTHEDITERRRAEERMSHLVHHDPLTGLANRLRLLGNLADLPRNVGSTGGIAVLCLDLDRFKNVNDMYGNHVGDALLCAATERLRGCVRENDMVARSGGDEFVVIQRGADQPHRAVAVAERLIDAFRQPFQVGDHLVTIGTSVGIAFGSPDTEEAEALLLNAGVALSRAKVEGRGVYRFFEPAMDTAARARRAMEKGLREALNNDEFEVYYQPKLNTETQQISGFEALVRWRHPEYGIVSPEDFIPLAEELGLIVPIGEWVLRRACNDAAGWPGSPGVAVNLSPVQFRASLLVDSVRTALRDSGLPANRLELEITETMFLQDSALTLKILHELRQLGVSISLDDFGTGYSSIAYLMRFPFDRIKIDRSFVRDMSAGTNALAIVQAVLNLGKSLRIPITAEGVETADQFTMLRAERCAEVQGYLVSVPVPARDVPGVISRFGSAAMGLVA